jgi:hypothetical protein
MLRTALASFGFRVPLTRALVPVRRVERPVVERVDARLVLRAFEERLAEAGMGEGGSVLREYRTGGKGPPFEFRQGR